MIGQVVSRAEGVVSKQEFQRWAAAVGDRNPLYFDADHARANGYEDVIAPPLYVQYATTGVVDLDRLRPDGIGENDGWGDLPLPGYPRRMAGGQELVLHGPVYDGTRVTAVRTITGVAEKHGRSGPFVIVTSLTRYTTPDGALLAEITDTLIARP